MTKNQIIRTVAFLLVVSVLLLTLCDLFEYENSHVSKRIETYKDLPKNTVDAVMVGTSGIDRYWITPKAYEEYGLTVYPLSTDASPTWMIKIMLKEAVKRQDPELVIIDMRSFTNNYYQGSLKFDVASRRVIDALDFFSLTRLEAIDTTLKYRAMVDEEAERFDPSYFLSFIRYHNKWESDLSFDELKDVESETLGFFAHPQYSTVRIGEHFETAKSTKRKALDPIAEESLYDLLDYLKQQDYQVLFLDTPYKHSSNEVKKINTLCDILTEEGFVYLACDINERYVREEHFYNDSHVNYYGAEIFTQWFSEYLKTSYDLPDRRLDEKCQKDWNGVYDNVKEIMKDYEEAMLTTEPDSTVNATVSGDEYEDEYEDEYDEDVIAVGATAQAESTTTPKEIKTTTAPVTESTTKLVTQANTTTE